MAVNPKVSRRTLVKAGAAGAAIAATAGGIAPMVGPINVAAQDLADIDRNRTLILRWSGQAGRYVDVELWNGYLPTGSNHQNGLGILHEPLAFYSAFADEYDSLAGRKLGVQRGLHRASHQDSRRCDLERRHPVLR